MAHFERSELQRLQKPLWKLILFSILTLSIYLFIRFAKLAIGIRGSRRDSIYKIFLVVASIVLLVTGAILKTTVEYYFLAGVLTQGSVLCLAMLNLLLGRQLEKNYGLKISYAVLFVFGFLYLQHRINKPTSHRATVPSTWKMATYLAVAVTLLLLRTSLNNFHVPTSSMVPTITPGDRIAVNVLLPPLGWKAKRGDLLAFAYPKDPSVTYIKRVWGIAGDTIALDGSGLKINGQNVCIRKEDYKTPIYVDDALQKVYYECRIGEHRFIQARAAPGSFFFKTEEDWTFQVPDGTYFVMGDSYSNSTDSRHWGFVPNALVRGEVAFHIFQFHDSNFRTERAFQKIL